MMLSYFGRIISLKNLHSKPQGQIATLLILMMVALLIFILVTVNLGQVSVTATNLSNVADSASLSLASQLATKANAIFQTLGGTKKCKSGGLASLVFAIVLAVIAIVVIILTWPVGGAPGWPILAAAGAAAGAAGGAIGASYAGTPVVLGALQGAMIGATIGYGAGTAFGTTAAGGTVGAGQVAGSGGAWVGEAGDTAYYAAGNSIPQGAVLSSGTAVPSVSTAASAIALQSLNTAASLYNASVADQNTSAAFVAAAKALSGLPEYDRIRESVFLQAFIQTVDDPVKVLDTRDLNGNGETDDKISRFLNWWDDRTNFIKNIFSKLAALVRGFIQGTLKDFKDYAKEQYAGGETYQDYSGVSAVQPGTLSRREVDGADGPVVELARSLGGGIVVPPENKPLWKSGIPPACACENCGENFYDGLQAVVCKLKDLVETIEGERVSGGSIQPPRYSGGLLNQDMDQLAYTWQTWINQFYDPETEWYPTYVNAQKNPDVNADWHDVLKNEIVPNLQAWKKGIENKRIELLDCNYGWWGEEVDGSGIATCNKCVVGVVGSSCSQDCILNPPCKFTPSGGSIDSDLGDEFAQVDQAIQNIIDRINSFYPQIKEFYDDIQAKYGKLTTDFHGRNPATYTWADSRCPPDTNDVDNDGDKTELTECHSITVEAGPFKITSTKSTESGNWLKNEKCLEMVDFSDDGSNTWVRITRQGPTNKEIKSGNVALGMWNPFFSGKITKKSRASYSFNEVKIVGKD